MFGPFQYLGRIYFEWFWRICGSQVSDQFNGTLEIRNGIDVDAINNCQLPRFLREESRGESFLLAQELRSAMLLLLVALDRQGKFTDAKNMDQVLIFSEITVAPSIPKAMGRSKLAPSLRTSAGARLIVVL